MTSRSNELHIAEDTIQVIRDDNKEYSEHVEEAEDGKKGLRDIEYDDQEDPEHSRTGMRKLLRRNPSYNFIRDVALADETPLDPAQVRKVSGIFHVWNKAHETAREEAMDHDCAGIMYGLHLLLHR